jgi:hypothetical protein
MSRPVSHITGELRAAAEAAYEAEMNHMRTRQRMVEVLMQHYPEASFNGWVRVNWSKMYHDIIGPE